MKNDKPTYDELEIQLAELKKQIEVQKRYENIDKINNAPIRDIVNNIKDIIVITDSEGLIIFVSHNIEKLFGWTPEDLMGKSIIEHLQIEKSDIILHSQENQLNETEAWMSKEFHYKCKDEKYKWIEIAWCSFSRDSEKNEIIYVFHDISCQKLLEETIDKNHKEYLTTIDSLHFGVVVFDSNAHILSCSREAINVLGIPAEVLLGKGLTNLNYTIIDENLSPLDVEDYPVNKVIATSVPLFNYELGIIYPGKDIIKWININVVPIFAADNKLDKVIVNFYDITTRKQSEKALRLYSERTKGLLKLNEMIEFSLHEIMDYALEEAVRLTQSKLGYLAFLNEDESVLTMYSWSKTAMAECATSEKPREYPVVNTGLWGECVRQRKPIITNDYAAYNPLKKGCPEGHVRLIRHMNIPVFDNSKIVLVAGVGNKAESYDQSDVEQLTLLMEGMWQLLERKRTADALKESERYSRQIIENAPFGAHHYELLEDGDLILRGANPAADNILGIDSQQFIGKNIRETFSILLQKDVLDAYRRVAKSGAPYNEEQLFYEDGQISGAYELHAFQTSPGRITVFFNDITERKRAEVELIHAKEKAEESDRLKSAFLANMSHEIRTPMNGILGFADLLKEPKLSGEEQQHYISIIQESGARMLNIINDIISISKIESGQMETMMTETNLRDQIQYLLIFFRPEAEDKGLLLFSSNVYSQEEIVVKTDKEKLYAILANLIKNAIKFTQSGAIEFGYIKKENVIEFYVKDTGVGITEKQQEIIFERFRQVNESINREFEGAGLGLSISKAYVELLGGKIWVESKPGIGSTFYFTLPHKGIPEKVIIQNSFQAKTNTPANNAELKKLKILIAEDDKISQFLLDKFITGFSKEVLFARTGLEAVELCRVNPDIDLVLMDIQMPDMDGYEASRQIRSFNENIVVIAQTAYALEGDKEKALASGCNDYISKPIDPGELENKIGKYFAK